MLGFLAVQAYLLLAFFRFDAGLGKAFGNGLHLLAFYGQILPGLTALFFQNGQLIGCLLTFLFRVFDLPVQVLQLFLLFFDGRQTVTDLFFKFCKALVMSLLLGLLVGLGLFGQPKVSIGLFQGNTGAGKVPVHFGQL